MFEGARLHHFCLEGVDDGGGVEINQVDGLGAAYQVH
jgi:hypothetical protein